MRQDMENRSTLEIVYDGECPFCTQFVKMVRLREVFGAVKLVDARASADPQIADLRSRYRLDDGFVVIHDGTEYYGPEAMDFLSLASASKGFISRLLRTPLFRGAFGRWTYPKLVAGRKLALRMLGRKLMGY
jgi:predicted DCC family thiol-disulfide oxidoreductase YuxK